MVKLCAGCKRNEGDAYTDSDTGEGYCAQCLSKLPVPNTVLAQLYLLNTIPFHVGDVVECRTAGVLYDGIGVIKSVSFDPRDGGSPVYPSFRVALTEKKYAELPDECNYTEVCLRRVEAK